MTRTLARRVARLELASQEAAVARIRAMSDEELMARLNEILATLPPEAVHELRSGWPGSIWAPLV
jgi:hypothetical protein